MLYSFRQRTPTGLLPKIGRVREADYSAGEAFRRRFESRQQNKPIQQSARPNRWLFAVRSRNKAEPVRADAVPSFILHALVRGDSARESPRADIEPYFASVRERVSHN